MKYFLNTKFIDTGSLVDLISIAIVAEDGRELYLQSCEFDRRLWVRKDVLDQLALCPHVHVRGKPSYMVDLAVHERGQCTFTSARGTCGFTPGCPWRTRDDIVLELLRFIRIDEEKPEIWGWCAGYDFVALCQLFGTMLDLPVGWPHYIRDLQYLLDERGITDDKLPPQTGQAHNALADARHLRELWTWLSVSGAAASRWNMPAMARERLRHGGWLEAESKHPLMLTGEAGVKIGPIEQDERNLVGIWVDGKLILKDDAGLTHTGGIIPPGTLAIVEEAGPASELVYGGEAGATILPDAPGEQPDREAKP